MPHSRSTSAIVVVNYGSSSLLAENLVPLSRVLTAAGSGCRIVVVDNRSSDDERSRISEMATQEHWELVEPDGNTGFGGGMNLGVGRATAVGATRFVLLNPDAVLDLEGFEALDAAVAAAPNTVFAPIVLRPDGSVWSGGSTLNLADGRTGSQRGARRTGARTVPWLSGACLALSLALWNEIGGFAEDYFLYWEDVEFSYRAAAVGGALSVLDGVHVVHDDGGTQRTGRRRDRGKSATYYYFNIRNRLMFAARNLSPEDVDAWVRNSGRVSREIMLRGGRRQFLLRPLSLTAAWRRGRRDGRRIARERLRTEGRA